MKLDYEITLVRIAFELSQLKNTDPAFELERIILDQSTEQELFSSEMKKDMNKEFGRAVRRVEQSLASSGVRAR